MLTSLRLIKALNLDHCIDKAYAIQACLHALLHMHHVQVSTGKTHVPQSSLKFATKLPTEVQGEKKNGITKNSTTPPFPDSPCSFTGVKLPISCSFIRKCFVPNLFLNTSLVPMRNLHTIPIKNLKCI